MITYWFLLLGVRNLGWAELDGLAAALRAQSSGTVSRGWLPQPCVSSNKLDNPGLVTWYNKRSKRNQGQTLTGFSCLWFLVDNVPRPPWSTITANPGVNRETPQGCGTEGCPYKSSVPPVLSSRGVLQVL